MGSAEKLQTLGSGKKDGPAKVPADGDGAPFRLKFRAWWDGRSVADVVRDEARRLTVEPIPDVREEVPVTGEPEPAAPPEPDIPWPPSRIAIYETVFGSGSMSPGGSARTLEMMNSFGLNPDFNVLELGSRLGGAARAIAMACDAWVTGFEPDAALAEAAMATERMVKALSTPEGQKADMSPGRLSDKARIAHADLNTVTIKAGLYDCVFAREALHRVEDPLALLDKIFGGLKPRAPFLLTDYFVAEGKENDPELQAWLASEVTPPNLITVPRIEKALSEIGFDLRRSEDITAQYRSDLIADLRRFIENHRQTGIPSGLSQPLLKLADTWAERVKALDAGLITVHKFIGLGLPN